MCSCSGPLKRIVSSRIVTGAGTCRSESIANAGGPPKISQRSPLSSNTSRRQHSAGSSFASRWPPNGSQSRSLRCQCSSTRPSCTTKPVAVRCRMRSDGSVIALALRWACAQLREEQHLADRRLVQQDHHQPVDADAEAAGGRHAVLQRDEEIL